MNVIEQGLWIIHLSSIPLLFGTRNNVINATVKRDKQDWVSERKTIIVLQIHVASITYRIMQALSTAVLIVWILTLNGSQIPNCSMSTR